MTLNSHVEFQSESQLNSQSGRCISIFRNRVSTLRFPRSIPHILLPALFSAIIGITTLGTILIPSQAWAQTQVQPHASDMLATNFPPSAKLHYSIKAKKHGFTLDGEALITWQLSGKAPNRTYAIKTETRAALLGKILQADSTGMIDSYGLAPLQFDEKRISKTAIATRFDRENKLIHFSEASITYPIKGGEQDRTSAIWQLISMARAAPGKMTPGSNWTLFVAGRRDAENWTFSIRDSETITTPSGPVATIHIVKAPPPDSTDQRLDIWLAPGMEWYPVRITFTDSDNDLIEQDLVSVAALRTETRAE